MEHRLDPRDHLGKWDHGGNLVARATMENRGSADSREFGELWEHEGMLAIRDFRDHRDLRFVD